MGLDTLLQYRYESYNAICIFSSVIGVLGAIYQVFKIAMSCLYWSFDLAKRHKSVHFQILPRQYEGTGRVLDSYMRGRQIIVWLATADLLASLGTPVMHIRKY